MQLVTGTCFNVSLFRANNGTMLLSIQLRAADGKIWKFNVGKAFDTELLTDYQDIYKIMTARSITMETDEANFGKLIFNRNKYNNYF